MIKIELNVKKNDGKHSFTLKDLELLSVPRINEKIVANETICIVKDIVNYPDKIIVYSVEQKDISKPRKAFW